MIETEGFTIAQARKLLDGKEISATELTTAYLAEIERQDGDIGAYLEVFDDALDRAGVADKMIAEGRASALTGIPCAIKDNIVRKGYQSTAASKILAGHVGVYDSYVASVLDGAGAVILGRTNMDEFAMGSSTETSAYQKTRNPIDPTRVPGGSSGGSAAAVAAGEALFALGSDTAGSNRQPASFCGIVGMYPTYGSVSRHGLMAMGSSLDQIGPLARTVADAEIIFKEIAEHDTMDATSVPLDTRKKIAPSSEVKTVGVPRAFLSGEGIEAEVLENFETSLKQLQELGYTVIDVEIPHIEAALPAYYIISPAEASTNFARYDGVRYGARVPDANLWDMYEKTRGEGFGPEVRRRILLGTYVLSSGYYDAYYHKAQQVRSVLKQSFREVFEQVDVIATPTTPTTAFAFGSKKDPVSMYLEDLFTVPANIAQIPALSLPAGKDSAGLPCGLHLTAPAFGEDRLFAVGKKFEAAQTTP